MGYRSPLRPFNQQDAFLRMLNKSYRDKDTNLLALSTLFSVLAYGQDFAKEFINFASAEGNDLKASLNRSREYFEVQQNFTQNYLNTCVAVSAFTVLSNAFCGNVEVLKFALRYELDNLEQEVPGGPKPAYRSFSFRSAPTVNEERKRLLDLCEKTLSTFENPPKTIKEQQQELLHVMEMTAALQSDTPTLLSLRVLKEGIHLKIFRECVAMTAALKGNIPVLLSATVLEMVYPEIFEECCGKCEFIASCALNLTGNLLAKVLSFGAYRSSLDLEERLNGVDLPKVNLFAKNNENKPPFEGRNLPEVWAEIFSYGTVLEGRGDNHCVAVKAAINEQGKKILVVYDPMQGKSEIIEVPSENSGA